MSITRLFLIFTIWLQSAAFCAAQADRVFMFFDLSKLASFPGGTREQIRFFQNNLHYPEGHSEPPKGTTLVISFIIEMDGTISDLRTLVTPGPAFTAEVERCLKSIQWIPAEANGHPVRQQQVYFFFFHHASKRFQVREGGLGIDAYDQLNQMHPDDYPYFINHPAIFMGFDTADTLQLKQQYPEAARKAGVQGYIGVVAYVDKSGQLIEVKLENDIGYGCGEEALRLARLCKAWVPARKFNMAHDTITRLLYSFCPDPDKLALSDKIYEEDSISRHLFYHNYSVERPVYIFRNGTFGKGVDTLKYDDSIVEFTCILNKDNRVDSLTILTAPNEAYAEVIRNLLSKEIWSAPRCCGYPCRIRLHRFATFRTNCSERSPFTEIVLTKQHPEGIDKFTPLPYDTTIYEGTMVDTPAFFKDGEKGIRKRIILSWPNYRQEFPADSVDLKLYIEKSGRVLKVKSLHEVHQERDKKLVLVIRDMRNWEPSCKNGHPVSSWVHLRIKRWW